MYPDPSILESLVTVAVLAVIVIATVRGHSRVMATRTRSPTFMYKYVAGKIDELELERRLGEAVNDRHEQIRLVYVRGNLWRGSRTNGSLTVEDINGVGPKTSKAIAREFDSLDELRGSDQARLEGVYGVGDETAGAVLERVRGNG